MTRVELIAFIVAAVLILATLALRQLFITRERVPTDDDSNRRKLIALDMRMRMRDSRDRWTESAPGDRRLDGVLAAAAPPLRNWDGRPGSDAALRVERWR